MIILTPGALLLLFLLMLGQPGHAQMSPMVECRVGSYAETMPDYACSALIKGAAKLTPDGHSITACADEMQRHAPPTNDGTLVAALTVVCGDVWRSKTIGWALRGQR